MLVSENTVAFVEYFGNRWSKLSRYISGVSLSVFYIAFLEGYVSYINSFPSKMKMNEMWLARTDKMDKSLAMYLLYTQYAQCWGTVPVCCFLFPFHGLRFPWCYILFAVSTNEVSCLPLLKEVFLGSEALPFTKWFYSTGRQSWLKSIDKCMVYTNIHTDLLLFFLLQASQSLWDGTFSHDAQPSGHILCWLLLWHFWF